MIDNYSHNDMDIIYVTECILGPADNSLEYEILLGDYNSQMLDNCVCPRACMKLQCKCLQLSKGDNYERYTFVGDMKFRLKYKILEITRGYPILECNSNCSCPPDCGNRVVQNGPLEGLIVKQCENEHKGLGLFASDYIRRGTFICEYAGELLTRTQALARIEQNEALNKMNYVFCLNEFSFGGMIQTFVDPSKFGNIGRYINHSCEPNCVVVPVRTETVIPRLAIFACKDIGPDEEFTFRYGSEEQVADGQYPGDNRKLCLCNSESCTGFLPLENF